MDNLKKVVSTAKKLINLPYNKFNLENYLSILNKRFNIVWCDTPATQPIKLMSGIDFTAGIIRSIPKSSTKKRIWVIGKGILFDSGGYNLKTGRSGPYGMHGDKAGAIIALTVANYFPDSVIAYCPITTNFIHNSKITPGDIIPIGKKKVEVNNTDAEGRLILAEAISTLNVSKDDIIITVATLTGCCAYAVDKATGVLTPSDKLAQLYLKASKDAKEYAWRLPLFDYMQNFYKTSPIQNSIHKIVAGTSEGAMFIKQFIKYPENWIHLDIASSAHKDERATGVPIKSLINFIKKIQ